jgi:ribosome-binding factor A
MARRREDGHGGGNQRRLRVGEEVRHAISRILQAGELRDPALAAASITVSEVRMSPDLRNATVFVMPLGGAHAPEIIEGLERCAPYLRSRVGRAVPMRHTPNLLFALDTSFEAAERIAAVLARPEVERDLHPPDPPDDDAG